MTATPRRLKVYTRRDLARIPHLRGLPQSQREAMEAVAAVLPFRVNEYVLDELIDWSAVPEDPMFQLTFPQPGMLEDNDFLRMYSLVRRGAPEAELRATAREIQQSLNPHPAGQLELNVPVEGSGVVEGTQHKYRETVLFFPSQGQTCHSYCTYCFRWAQFVGIEELKFASREADNLADYVRSHPSVSSVLLTGGDPMVMKTRVLRQYVEPLLDPSLEHLRSIRIGTKAPAYWPYRFVTDDDADDLMRLFEEVRAAGKHLALMAHYSHPVELSTGVAAAAVRRIQDTGAVVRCQAPLIRNVNDRADVWAELWRQQERLGAVPYYMFVERDTGARHYFEVPPGPGLPHLPGCLPAGLGAGAHGARPSMSATPGKVLVDGITTVKGERVFVLKFLQAPGSPSGWACRSSRATTPTPPGWTSCGRPSASRPSSSRGSSRGSTRCRSRPPARGPAAPCRRGACGLLRVPAGVAQFDLATRIDLVTVEAFAHAFQGLGEAAVRAVDLAHLAQELHDQPQAAHQVSVRGIGEPLDLLEPLALPPGVHHAADLEVEPARLRVDPQLALARDDALDDLLGVAAVGSQEGGRHPLVQVALALLEDGGRES